MCEVGASAQKVSLDPELDESTHTSLVQPPQPMTGAEPRGVQAKARACVAAMGIKPFNPKDIIEYATIMVFGARRIGKTHLVTWLLSKIHSRFDRVVLMSQTIEFQPDAWDFIPEDDKISRFDEGFISELITKQRQKIEKARNSIMNNGKGKYRRRGSVVKKTAAPSGDKLRDMISKKVPHVCLILDDIINDPAVRRSALLAKLFVSGRHLRITLIILSQSAARSAVLSGVMRANVDLIFTSEMDSQDDYETVAELFFCRDGKRIGIERIKQLTQAQYCFGVSNLSKRGKKGLGDHTYIICAPAHIPKFTLKSMKALDRRNSRKRKAGDAVDFGYGASITEGRAEFTDKHSLKKMREI